MARPGRVSDITAQRWLDDLAVRATHLGLSTQDPYTVNDPLTVEPQALGYNRAPVTWARSGRVLRNAVPVSWTGLPPATRIVSITLWSAAVNGELLANVPIEVIELATSGGFPIGVQQLFVGLDL